MKIGLTFMPEKWDCGLPRKLSLIAYSPTVYLVQVSVTPMLAPLAICMSASPLDGKPCEAGLCLVHHCTPGTQHKAPSGTAYEAPNME